MLLDSITVNTQKELDEHLKLLLDSTSMGSEVFSHEQLTDSSLSIGKTLTKVLIEEHGLAPSHAWSAIVATLRCLPWTVDPELALVRNRSEGIQAVYRHFGGLEFTKFDDLLSELREKVEEGAPWLDIVHYACMEIKGKQQ